MDHQKIIEQLNAKIEEATIMAKSLESEKKDKLAYQSAKVKIFEVLRLIYEQQKAVGA